MRHHLIGLLTAARFLTIIPFPWYRENDSEYFQTSVHFFVAVGVCIGGLIALLCIFFQLLLPQHVLCVVAILFLSLISGFLHLDGLADTADGFFSARPKEKILTIMHDSRIGAMGVVALVFLLLLKYAALVSVSGEDLIVTLFFMPMSGRLAIVLTMSYVPYAREGGGLGKLFYNEGSWNFPKFSLLVFFVAGVLCSGFLTCIVFITVAATVLLFGLWCKKVIGGATGDTLGAVCEITETGVAVVLSSLLTI